MQINQLSGLYNVGSHKMAGKVAYPLHGHNFGEIFWVARGEMRHCINGEEQELRKGDCCWLRPRDVHSLHSVNGRKPFWIVNVAFQWSSYEALRRRYFQGGPDVYGEDADMPRLVQFNPGGMERIGQDALRLVHESRSPFNIERFLMNVITECGIEREVGKEAVDMPSWLKQACGLYRNPQHFRKGAAGFYPLCGKSAEHVSREFHRYCGKTIQEYAQELKMEHAATLLEGSPLEIMDISMECGFDSLSHFYLAFRQYHEMTPAQYRKKVQGEMYPSM